MAQIDLRNAIVRILDGYEGIGAGAVNLMAGYAAGLATVAVDGFVGAVANGEYVKFAGHADRYKITAHTETLGNTTSITFTPVLQEALVDNEVVTVQPHQIEVIMGDGNLTYDEKRAFKYTTNRGVLDTVRQEADIPVDISLDGTWEFLRGDSGDIASIEDALKQRGPASSWVSSAADECEPYAVDIEVEYVPVCTGVKRELITLQDFRWESFNHDLKMGMLAVKGKANVTEATVVRV